MKGYIPMTSTLARSPGRGSGSPDDGLPVALIRFGPQVGATDVNEAWSALTGLERDASLGRGWLDALASEQRAEAALLVDSLLAVGGMASTEWQLACGDPRRWVEASIGAERTSASQSCSAALLDVTERRAREADLARRANHDPLTGLANRSLLADRTEHALSRLGRRPGLCAMLFIDLDQFKIINDNFGHDQGDRTLAALAQRLLHAMRSEDTLARVGGDEFVMLCEDLTTPEEALAVADRLLAATRYPLNVRGGTLVITASIGVAFADGPDASIPLLLHRADRAMYTAKRRGGDGLAVDGSEILGTVARATSEPVAPYDGAYELTSAISHLTSAADALDRLASAEMDRDGARWISTNEARYGLHRTLVNLREAADDRAVPTPRPL